MKQTRRKILIGIVIVLLIWGFLVMRGCETLPNDPKIESTETTPYDTTEAKRDSDSIDECMRYWYEVLDTNSNGDIDDTEHTWVGGNGIKFKE